MVSGCLTLNITKSESLLPITEDINQSTLVNLAVISAAVAIPIAKKVPPLSYRGVYCWKIVYAMFIVFSIIQSMQDAKFNLILIQKNYRFSFF